MVTKSWQPSAGPGRFPHVALVLSVSVAVFSIIRGWPYAACPSLRGHRCSAAVWAVLCYHRSLPTRGIRSPSGFLVRGHISMGKMSSGLGSTRPIAWAGGLALWERRLVPTYAVPEGLLLAPKYHFANNFCCGSPCRFCVFLVAFAPCREHHACSSVGVRGALWPYS